MGRGGGGLGWFGGLKPQTPQKEGVGLIWNTWPIVIANQGTVPCLYPASPALKRSPERGEGDGRI